MSLTCAKLQEKEAERAPSEVKSATSAARSIVAFDPAMCGVQPSGGSFARLWPVKPVFSFFSDSGGPSEQSCDSGVVPPQVRTE